MLVYLRSFDADLTGRQAQNALDKAGVTLNFNTVPDDPRPPFQASGVRLGTAAVTTQGMREPEMATIASLIGRVLRHRDDASETEVLRKEVVELCNRFTPYPAGAAASN